MLNTRRLLYEIETLEGIFGIEHIEYASNGSWIKIRNFPLPRKYNLHSATILIMIPSNYDVVSVEEVYVDKRLLLRTASGFTKLPNSHSRNYENIGYQWLCFHAKDRFISLLDFVNCLGAYFNNPCIFT